MNNFLQDPKYSAMKMVFVLFFFILVGVFALGTMADRRAGTTAQVLDTDSGSSSDSFTISGVANGQSVSGVIAVSAEGVSGSTTEVEVLIDGNAYVTITKAPWNTNIDTNRLAPGSHTITMTAGGATEEVTIVK